ncbi:MAG: hypothetical protein OEQ39_05695 [Gammaproteobacteria bacterium]|nr:hypothetical protein [Gammaproteobacteria bacterium]
MSTNSTEMVSASQDFQAPAVQVLAIEEARNMVSYVEEVTSTIMREGPEADFGLIPGVNKKVLFQPGAQKLGLAFQLRPEYEEECIEESVPGHRTWHFKCRLFSRANDRAIGEGVGSCSTMESKWRYRWDSTGDEVPKEYWSNRDPALIGGAQFSTRKKNNTWLIFMKVDHPDIADTYNTVRKMAKKRAYVDAIIMATACSHLFTQDMEDLPSNDNDFHAASTDAPAQATARQPMNAPTRKSASAPRAVTAKRSGGSVTDKQIYRAWAIGKANGIDKQGVQSLLIARGIIDDEGQAPGKDDFASMTREQYDNLCDKWLNHIEDDDERIAQDDNDARANQNDDEPEFNSEPPDNVWTDEEIPF